MKKAVITILGTIGGRFDQDKKEYVFVKNTNKSYYSSKLLGLKDEKYINMLPLLIDVYSDEYEIIPIYTKDAAKIQKLVLSELENKKEFLNIFDNGVFIKNENDFNEVFEAIDKKLDEYEEVIVDVTHGFRHLPILMIIDLIIQNIKQKNKIKFILFAKEIVKPIKENNFVGKYDIIDLRQYLDLANITYALSTFTKNYTISSTIKTSNEEYNNFLDELNKFSYHILANSLKELKSISINLYKRIDDIMKNQYSEKDKVVFKTVEKYLIELKEHMKYIGKISNLKEDYKRLYHFAENMNEKGYLLNAITLLSEAMGMYCAYVLSQDEEIKNYIEEYKKSNKYKAYELSNNSKNILRYKNGYKGLYLYNEDKRKAKKITNKIKNMEFLNEEKIVDLVKKIDNLRNNLAHGNSSEAIADVEQKIKNYLEEFKNLARIENV